MLNFLKLSLRHTAVILAGSGGLVAGMILAVPGVASAATLTCGQSITTNTTLTANLNCTSYTGEAALTIGAADVTLNLNGHKILGPGDSAGNEGISDGSDTTAGYSGVTVENGSLSNFFGDIIFYGGSGADLTGIVVHHITTTDKTPESSTSVFGDYLDAANFNQVTSVDAGTALELEDSENSTVSGNHLTSPYVGVWDITGTADSLSGNVITNGQESGIETGDAVDDVIADNTVNGTRNTFGVYDEGAQNITVTGNTLNDVYYGVGDFYGTAGTISHNTGTGDVWGIYTGPTDDYTITGNMFSHGEYGMETDFPDGEVLTGNTVNDNAETGIYVWTNDDTSGYSATLTSNTANDNRFGLYSQIATTGSKNHASGNKVVNCYNVTCTKAKGSRSLVVAPPPHDAPQFRAAPARWGRQ